MASVGGEVLHEGSRVWAVFSLLMLCSMSGSTEGTSACIFFCFRVRWCWVQHPFTVSDLGASVCRRACLGVVLGIALFPPGVPVWCACMRLRGHREKKVSVFDCALVFLLCMYCEAYDPGVPVSGDVS